MGADADQLWGFVELWKSACDDVVALTRTLEPADWDTPTQLPGWNVRAVMSHLAHLESELAGKPQAQVEVPDLPHVNGMMSQFTEMGPIARRETPGSAIVDELEDSVAIRFAALQADPPTDASAPGPGFAGLVGWSWGTLLRNRVLDVWMHEQDIRAAVGRPGGLDSPAAGHVAGVYTKALSFVLGKKVGAAPGTAVVLDITGAQTHVIAAAIGEDGRGTLIDPPATPTAVIKLDFADWIALSGGRVTIDDVTYTCEGDAELAAKVLTNLNTTP